MRFVPTLAAALLLTLSLAAQNQPPANTPPTAGAVALPPPSATDLVLVDATCRAPFRAEGSQDCRLGDTVLVRFTNLQAWIALDPVKHDPANLIIALNNHALTGIHANVLISNSNAITFNLTVPEGTDPDAEANKQAWREILRKHHTPTTMTLSVGTRGGPVFYGPVKLLFHLYPGFAPLVFGGVILLIAAVGWMAVKTNLIRAPGPQPATGERPYSLGRAQMAWWFVMVVASYLYIWLLTENRDSLTNGVLILTGISAATGLSSQVVGAKGQPPAAPGTPAAGSSPDPNFTAPTLTPMVPVPATTANVSRGFLTDILGDENGVSFDRMQMAVWTIVLGLVFVVEVINDLSMPDFSPTLLGLMGISSGTYIGFKLPGKG